MTPEQEAKAQGIIERQIEMSVTTLDALHRAGLTDDREIQINFFYDAPNEAPAQALIAHLAKNDCLNLLRTDRGPQFESGLLYWSRKPVKVPGKENLTYERK